MNIDGTTLVLLAVAALPWLGGIVESIDLPGGGSVHYRRLEERIEVTERYAGEASHTAQAALGAASAGRPGAALGETGEAPAKVTELAARYEEVRATPRGPARTESMSRLFGELMAWTPLVDTFDVAAALGSSDAGLRLAAYARLYATGDTAFLNELLRTLMEIEDKPFSQYWGIRALSVLQQVGAEIPADDVARLRARFATLPRASDRRMELNRVLQAATGVAQHI
uniref:HEAT repeat domain-containing protein n=1 Tax=Streptomyces sp. NBC_00003 TaxID=2903608 RepID=A0AAU2UWQ2_9ACTN